MAQSKRDKKIAIMTKKKRVPILDSKGKPKVVQIFVKGNKLEKVVLPKELHHQIIDQKKGSIGQANNYPKLVREF